MIPSFWGQNIAIFWPPAGAPKPLQLCKARFTVHLAAFFSSWAHFWTLFLRLQKSFKNKKSETLTSEVVFLIRWGGCIRHWLLLPACHAVQTDSKINRHAKPTNKTIMHDTGMEATTLTLQSQWCLDSTCTWNTQAHKDNDKQPHTQTFSLT